MGIIKSNKSWFRQLSYDIAKTHGNEFKVMSKENEGSRFTIKLSIQ